MPRRVASSSSEGGVGACSTLARGPLVVSGWACVHSFLLASSFDALRPKRGLQEFVCPYPVSAFLRLRQSRFASKVFARLPPLGEECKMNYDVAMETQQHALSVNDLQ